MVLKAASSYLPHTTTLPKIHSARGPAQFPWIHENRLALGRRTEKQEPEIREWMNGVWTVWRSRCAFEAVANLGRCVHLSGSFLQHPLAGLLRVLSVSSHKIPFPGHFRHCPARSKWLLSDLAVLCSGGAWGIMDLMACFPKQQSGFSPWTTPLINFPLLWTGLEAQDNALLEQHMQLWAHKAFPWLLMQQQTSSKRQVRPSSIS